MERSIRVTRKDKVAEALEAHFKQWQEVGERMRDIVAPVLKQQEQFQKSLQSIIEAKQAFQKALEPILAEHERWKKLTFWVFVLRYKGS